MARLAAAVLHAGNAAIVRGVSLPWMRDPCSPTRLEGETRMDEPLTPEDRNLVHALMLRGWSRDGHEAPDDAGPSVWQFRAGHTLDNPERQAIKVRAPSQRAAMRTLLQHLHKAKGSANPLRVPVADGRKPGVVSPIGRVAG
jgi:hypothetical protein